VKRIVLASSRPDDLVLDCFAGSGATGEASLLTGRRFILIDDNPAALEVMAKRFARSSDIEWIGFDPTPFQD
jgi:site-specific DNA-methyltransferase (adenine-specific)